MSAIGSVTAVVDGVDFHQETINDYMPDEILMRIFSNLNEKDLFVAGQTCRRWRQVSSDPFLWEMFIKGANLLTAGDYTVRELYPLMKVPLSNVKEILRQVRELERIRLGSDPKDWNTGDTFNAVEWFKSIVGSGSVFATFWYDDPLAYLADYFHDVGFPVDAKGRVLSTYPIIRLCENSNLVPVDESQVYMKFKLSDCADMICKDIFCNHSATVINMGAFRAQSSECRRNIELTKKITTALFLENKDDFWTILDILSIQDCEIQEQTLQSVKEYIEKSQSSRCHIQ